MPSCPMAMMCKGMTEKRGAVLWMLVPGLVFIALGVAIVLYPKILVWLAAILLIAMGVAMLMMAGVMRNFGNRMHDRPA